MAEPLELVNRALYAIGESGIASMAEVSTKSTLVNALWANATHGMGVRDAVLREWPMRSVECQAPVRFTSTTLTLSAATVGVGRTFTAAAAFFSSNDVDRKLYEVDADGADTGATAEITAFTSALIVVGTITTAWSGVGAHAANRWRMQPQQTFSEAWAYEYVFPSGLISVLEATAGAQWVRVGNRLYSNTTPLHIRYTYRSTDPADWDPLLYEAMVIRLAAELSEPLERKGQRPNLLAEYELKKAEAQMASEGERSVTDSPSSNTLLTWGR